MSQATTPPPSSLERAKELDTVRDVMLLETEEQMRVDPIARHDGARAARGALEAQLRACRVGEDWEGERDLALELSRQHFELALDIDLAVQLLHRALEIQDDRELRAHLARQLATMGRHLEAGHVLRDGEPQTQEEVFVAWLGSGAAYARAGDADEAVATFREAAMVAPEDPAAYERIAAMAHWAPELVGSERAADAWLEAARRYPVGGAAHATSVIRAFEVAPSYARSAEAYARLLNRGGRPEQADQVWRLYGIASGHVIEVAIRRAESAFAREAWPLAFAAALDACASAVDQHQPSDSTLGEIAADEGFSRWLGAHAVDGDARVSEILAAAVEPARPRAETLSRLASCFVGDARGIILALAADGFAVAGDIEAACRAVLAAAESAPTSARVQAAVMDLAAHEAIDIATIENALAHLPARTTDYRTVAERCDFEGAARMALVWSRRVVALRPCEIAPIEALLDRAVGTGDVSLMTEAVGLAISIERPWRDLAPALARALRVISGRDLELGLDAAHRVLHALGPGDDELLGAILRISEAGGDRMLALAAVLGRAVGDEIGDDDRAAVYLEAAESCLPHGDGEAAAVHVSRAAALGGDLERLRNVIDRIESSLGALAPEVQSDTRLAVARARAWAAEQEDAATAALAWRTLGAMRWDLAEDAVGADEAYFVACTIDPHHGPYRYAQDLKDRAGPNQAFPMIVERAVQVEHDSGEARLYARLYAAAARIAADAGMRELALDAAVAAVRADASRGDAVAVVEMMAGDDEQGLAALNFVYDNLAEAAMGRYGFRAAHYRAARQLEKHRAYSDALRHAILAFEAVPSVGATYEMLLRLADRSGNEDAAVTTLAAVAAGFPVEGQIAWLVRAAELAKKSAIGAELRIELLLKAFALRQSVDVVDMLEQAATEIIASRRREEVDASLLPERLERAIASALPKLSRPREAPVAVSLAVMAARCLHKPDLAVETLRRAMELDGHDTDYDAFIPCIARVTEDRDAAQRLLEEINELRADSSRPIAKGLKEITSQLYLALSDVPPPPPRSSTSSSSSGPVEASKPAAEDLADESDVFDVASEPPAQASDGAPDGVATIEADEVVSEPEITTFTPTAPEPHGEENGLDEAAGDPEPETTRAPDSVRLASADESPDAASDHGADDAREGAAIEIGPMIPADEAVTQRPPPGVGPPDPFHDAVTIPPTPRPPPTEPPGHDEGERATGIDLRILDDIEGASTAEHEDAETFDPHDAGEPPALRVATGDTDLPAVAEAIDYSPASEARARERGDHTSIAKMLAARARDTDNLEQRRLIRLRRAAVLEQRLDRLDESCVELEKILEENGEDPTALRYLADLCDRQRRHARAAKLWLRASQQATDLEERLRDVVRCCESLIFAERPETAKKLIDAARGLPQSARMLELRVAVARKLGDEEALRRALAELAALDGEEPMPASRAGEERDDEVAPVPLRRRRHLIREPRGRQDGERTKSSRRVFRVTGAPPPVDADAERTPAEVLEACRKQFIERGAGSPREAKRMIRRLRSVMSELDPEDRDLHTYLLVECLDAAQGTGAAMHALQQHWESHGGTPLVTVAVADRLVRRHDLRPALQLYRRSVERDLGGVRSNGAIALQAAEIAHQLEDVEAAKTYLRIAGGDPDVLPAAELRYSTWFPGAERFTPSAEPPRPLRSRTGPPERSRRTSLPAPHGPSDTPTDRPRSAFPRRSNEPGESEPPAEERLSEPPDDDSERPTIELGPAHELDAMALDDDGTVREPTPKPASIPSIPPSSPFTYNRPPTFPELRSANEESLFNELIDGSYEAGDALVTGYEREGVRRSHDVLAVRRYQALLRRGDRATLYRLREAALRDSATAFARAIDHVAAAFDAEREPLAAPVLNQLSAQPEATSRLLFGSLEGTANEALGLVWDAGMLRRELTDYELSGADRVPPVATTAVGRVFAALGRLVDLQGARLFHPARSSGRLRSRVALVSPLAAIVTGNADRETPALRYVLGSALAAATPALALVEGLDEKTGRNLVAALLAGFGPVEEGSVAEATPEQMRLAEDLWHMLPAASDRRLRTICENRMTVTYEVALSNARRARRRAGLFACGDLVTAIMQTIHELDLPVPRPLRGADTLRELTRQPELADLYDLAIVPELAEVRWRTA